MGCELSAGRSCHNRLLATIVGNKILRNHDAKFIRLVGLFVLIDFVQACPELAKTPFFSKHSGVRLPLVICRDSGVIHASAGGRSASIPAVPSEHMCPTKRQLRRRVELRVKSVSD